MTCCCNLLDVYGPEVCKHCNARINGGQTLPDPFIPTQLGPQEHAPTHTTWRPQEDKTDRIIEQNAKIIELLEELIKLGIETKKLLS